MDSNPTARAAGAGRSIDSPTASASGGDVMAAAAVAAEAVVAAVATTIATQAAAAAATAGANGHTAGFVDVKHRCVGWRSMTCCMWDGLALVPRPRQCQ